MTRWGKFKELVGYAAALFFVVGIPLLLVIFSDGSSGVTGNYWRGAD